MGSEITKRFAESLDEDTYTVNCHGGGGQSFGAFIPKGMTMRLTGDSNDYFGNRSLSAEQMNKNRKSEDIEENQND